MTLCRIVIIEIETGRIFEPAVDAVDIRQAETLKKQYDEDYDPKVWYHLIASGNNYNPT